MVVLVDAYHGDMENFLGKAKSIVSNEKKVKPHARNKMKEGTTTLWRPLILPVKHLSRCGEVHLSHPHSAFPKSEASFRTYSFHVGPRNHPSS